MGTVDDTTSDDSNLTNGGTKIILANVPVEPNYKHGVTFFVGKFANCLHKIHSSHNFLF